MQSCDYIKGGIFQAGLLSGLCSAIRNKLNRERIMSESSYQVTYTVEGSSSVRSVSVRASSVSEAKQKIKAQWGGKAKIISGVKK
jgi:hypothetical protein